MTSSTVSSTFTLERDRIRRAAVPAGVASFVVAGIWTVLGAHNMMERLVVLPTSAVVTILVYWVVLPRALRKPNAAGTALALSIPAVLLLPPAFWSGLPLVLGVAGAMLGYAGRGAVSGSARSITACALGLLAAVGYLTIYVWDGIILGHM